MMIVKGVREVSVFGFPKELILGLPEEVLREYNACCILTNKKRAELFTCMLSEWIEKNNFREEIERLKSQIKEQDAESSPMGPSKGWRMCIVDESNCL